jgi:Flp pilus assembly secretin CpaC
LRLQAKRARVFVMRSFVAVLALAVCSPVFLIGPSASGAGKLVTFPDEQAASPQQPAVSHPAFKDIRPSGPPIFIKASEGTLLHLQDAVRYVFIADNDVADVQVEREQPKLIYVTAKKQGRTVLYAVDNAGQVLLNKNVEVYQEPLSEPVTIIRAAKIDTGKPPPPPNFLVLPLQPPQPAAPETP